MKAVNILRKGLVVGAAAAALTLGNSAMAAPKGTVSVLNWWTSGSEAESMQVLQGMLADEGYKMINDAVSGGGGANARTVLKSRIQSGNIPGAAQIIGPQIQKWCQTGLTMSIDKVAKQDNWNEILPKPVRKSMQCKGHYVAVPFNLHRINWLWINKAVLDKVNADIPTDWDSLVATLKKLKAAGITPIAGGGNTWQVATEFDAIAIATGGADFYRQAFIKLDPDAISGDTMIKALKRLRTIQKFEDPNGQGLTWNHDTGMVVQGEAAMQIMGDWAKGEITNSGATPGEEIACIAFPGEHDGFVYDADSLVMFANSNSDKSAQYALAHIVLTSKFQRQFNLSKGSIPVNKKVSLEGFDACAQKSEQAFLKADANHTLVPSFSQNDAVTTAVQGAIFDVLAKFTNNKDMTAQAAAQQMASRIKQVKMLSSL